MNLTIDEVEDMIKAACVSGTFGVDNYYDHAVDVSAGLMEDRRLILTAIQEALKRLPPHSPSAILLRKAAHEAQQRWKKKSVNEG